MGTFLDDLPGIRDVVYEDSAPLPRRSVLRFVGPSIRVEDNPVLGTTDLILDGAPVGQAVTATLTLADNPTLAPVVGDEWVASLVEMVRVVCTAAVTIRGLHREFLSPLTIINASQYTVTLTHEDALASDALDRMLLPSNASYQLASGRVTQFVRDPINQRWRLVL